MPGSSREPAAAGPDLVSLRETWTRLGEIDPLWAILSDPSKKGRKWDVAEFFRSGEDEIAERIEQVRRHGVDLSFGTALDFGCGVGRATQALSRRFATTHGVDIAESMIRLANRFNQAAGRCVYHVNPHADLRLFGDSTFDFVYSRIVLQHIPPELAKTYVREFLRVLRPGGAAVFQLPADLAPPPILPGQTQGEGPLGDEAFRAGIEVLTPVRRLPKGARHPVKLRVRNLSPVSWPALRTPDGLYGVRVGNQWLTRKGEVFRRDDGRATLPADLEPGARVDTELMVTAPDEPGRFVLGFDLVQEGVDWFQHRGSTPVRLPVKVGRRRRREGHPTFDMHSVPRAEVEQVIDEAGGRVVAVLDDDSAGDAWISYFYVATKPPSREQE